MNPSSVLICHQCHQVLLVCTGEVAPVGAAGARSEYATGAREIPEHPGDRGLVTEAGDAQTFSLTPTRNGDSTAARIAAAERARETSGLPGGKRHADGWGPKERRLSGDKQRSDVGNSQLSRDNRPFCVGNGRFSRDKRPFCGAPNTCAQTDVAPCPLHNSPADSELGRRYRGNALPPKASVVAPKPFKERRRGRFYDDPRTTMPAAAPAAPPGPTAEPGSETTTEVKQRAARRKDETHRWRATNNPHPISGKARVASLGKHPDLMPGERAGVGARRWAVPTTFLAE